MIDNDRASWLSPLLPAPADSAGAAESQKRRGGATRARPTVEMLLYDPAFRRRVCDIILEEATWRDGGGGKGKTWRCDALRDGLWPALREAFSPIELPDSLLTSSADAYDLAWADWLDGAALSSRHRVLVELLRSCHPALHSIERGAPAGLSVLAIATRLVERWFDEVEFQLRHDASTRLEQSRAARPSTVDLAKLEAFLRSRGIDSLSESDVLDLEREHGWKESSTRRALKRLKLKYREHWPPWRVTSTRGTSSAPPAKRDAGRRRSSRA